MSEYDENKSHEIAPGIYWVGFADRNAGFSNNPYLIIDSDGTGILIDPGSRADEHFNIVKRKVGELISFEKIKYIIVHHQDPDLCASIPLFEELIGVDNVKIITTLRTSLFIPYYGSKAEIIIIEDGDEFELPSGRILKFITTPYVHFAGSFVTFDTKEQVLFSSDIFAAFSFEWKLYADENYVQAVKAFTEPYIGCKEPVISAAKKLSTLPIKIIAPQHGSIIKENLEKYINALFEMEYGAWL